MIQRQDSNQRRNQLVSYNGVVYAPGQIARDPSQDVMGQPRQFKVTNEAWRAAM